MYSYFTVPIFLRTPWYLVCFISWQWRVVFDSAQGDRGQYIYTKWSPFLKLLLHVVLSGTLLKASKCWGLTGTWDIAGESQCSQFQRSSPSWCKQSYFQFFIFNWVNATCNTRWSSLQLLQNYSIRRATIDHIVSRVKNLDHVKSSIHSCVYNQAVRQLSNRHS